jgi:hypothetical protein
MREVVEREEIVSDAGSGGLRNESSTREAGGYSDQRIQGEDFLFGGLKHQVDEDDWLI